MKYTSVFVLLFLFIISCNTNNTNTNIAKEDTTFIKFDTVRNAALPENETPQYSKIEMEIFLRNITTCTDSVKNVLPGLNPQQANQLYKTTKAYIENQITLLKGEAHYMDWYCDLNDLKHQADSIQKEVSLYKTVNLEPWDVGEGIIELRTKPNFYITLFGKYVSLDYNSYLQMKCCEDSILYQSDAALIIPFDTIGMRMVNWENFIHQYPNSELRSEAIKIYNDYLHDYFIGEDNTPTFDQDKMDAAAAKAYKNISSEYGNTLTGALSEKFLALFGDKQSSNDERHKFLEASQEKIKKK